MTATLKLRRLLPMHVEFNIGDWVTLMNMNDCVWRLTNGAP